MTYDLSPDGPPKPPRDAEMPLPGERDRRSDKIEIEDDVCCVHCGYNLRGLPWGQRCPECGSGPGHYGHQRERERYDERGRFHDLELGLAHGPTPGAPTGTSLARRRAVRCS